MVREEGEGGSSNNYRRACAGCRHQRRKCREDCVLAPYFPMEKNQQYLAVHRVFGFSNMTKMLSNLDEQERKEAVKSFEWEAMMWQQDPVHGPLGAYKKALDMINGLLTQQQSVQSFDSMLMMGMTHDLSVFNNNGGSIEGTAVAVSNNGVPPLSNNNWAGNNIGQASNAGYYYERSLVPSHSSVTTSFGDVFGNEVQDSKVFAPNGLLQRNSTSLLQPNYMPNMNSVTSVSMPSCDMDQATTQNRDRGFHQYYNGNMVNKQMGLVREEDQGNVGSVENIYYDGNGQMREISQRGRTGQAQENNGLVIPVKNSAIAANTDNAMGNSRVRSQTTDIPHLLYQYGHGRIKQNQLENS